MHTTNELPSLNTPHLRTTMPTKTSNQPTKQPSRLLTCPCAARRRRAKSAAVFLQLGSRTLITSAFSCCTATASGENPSTCKQFTWGWKIVVEMKVGPGQKKTTFTFCCNRIDVHPSPSVTTFTVITSFLSILQVLKHLTLWEKKKKRIFIFLKTETPPTTKTRNIPWHKQLKETQK